MAALPRGRDAIPGIQECTKYVCQIKLAPDAICRTPTRLHVRSPAAITAVVQVVVVAERAAGALNVPREIRGRARRIVRPVAEGSCSEHLRDRLGSRPGLSLHSPNSITA